MPTIHYQGALWEVKRIGESVIMTRTYTDEKGTRVNQVKIELYSREKHDLEERSGRVLRGDRPQDLQ